MMPTGKCIEPFSNMAKIVFLFWVSDMLISGCFNETHQLLVQPNSMGCPVWWRTWATKRLLFSGMSTLQIFWGSWRGDFWGTLKQRRAFINCTICKARNPDPTCRHVSRLWPFSYPTLFPFSLRQRCVDSRQRDSIIELLTFMPKAAVSNWQ